MPKEGSTTNSRTILVLFAGILCGIGIAVFLSWLAETYLGKEGALVKMYNNYKFTSNFDKEDIKKQGYSKDAVQNNEQALAHPTNQKLERHGRILIMVMVAVNNYNRTIKAIQNTWGKKCDAILFFGTKADDNYPIVVLNTTDGRDFLWEKTKFAFMYSHSNYIEQFDWFVKADDDSFIIMENLKYFLSDKNASDPLYFGCPFKLSPEFLYMSGGASYVLSNKAVRMFIETMEAKKCRRDASGSEDAEMANAGISIGDSRDALGRGRFFPFPPGSLLSREFSQDWFEKMYVYQKENQLEVCSISTISFHYVPPKYMYSLYYMVYYLNPYGFTSEVLSRPDDDFSLTHFVNP